MREYDPEDYYWGMKVTSSEMAEENGLFPVKINGIVLHRTKHRVWVVTENHRTVATYHPDFWDEAV